MFPRLLILLFTLSLDVWAGSGSLQGRLWVEGETFSPIGAKVTLAGTPPIVAEVAKDGTYSFYGLLSKKYDMTAEWPEVGTQIKTDVEVSPNDPVIVDFGFKTPRPTLLSIYPPTITSPRAVTLTGEHFLHQAQAAMEVRIGDKIVPAVRKSDTEIMISSETIGTYFRSLGTKRTTHEIPLIIKINGVASPEALIAFQNTTPGSISAEVALSNPRVPLTGARFRIPVRGTDVVVPEKGRFEITRILPQTYLVALDWPEMGLHQEQKLEVLPGQNVPLKIKVEIPHPQVNSVMPEKLEKPEPVVLKGNHFLHSLKANMELNVGDIRVAAKRISNQIIQIPADSVAKILKTYPDKRDLTGTVLIAGVESKPFPLPVHGESKAPPTLPARDTAAAEEETKPTSP